MFSTIFVCLLTVLVVSFSLSPFLISYAETVEATEDSWTTMEPMPTPFYSTIGAAAVDGKIYFLGSHINGQYDLETNTWTAIAPLPTYNDWSTVVACQNKIYVIGGSAETPTQVYDPATDTWENKTPIPTTRSALQANVVDGKIYVIGGQIPSPLGVVNPSSANDVYDPATDTWSKMASIPTPVMGYASAVLDNKIYIIGGGKIGGPDYSPINQVQIFDPKTNQWTNGIPIPTGVISARACATTGLFAPKRIYVIGGTLTSYYRWASYNVIDLNQVYDQETDTWTTGTPMSTPRCALGIAVVNDELYAIGGHNGSGVVPANEKYTPIGYIPELPNDEKPTTPTTEPFPTTWVVAAIAIIAIVGATLLVYFKKVKKTTGKVEQQSLQY